VPLADLASSSRYLFETYGRADAAFQGFLRTQDPAALTAAAGYLCDGLTRLDQDMVFWGALVDLDQDYAQHQAQVDEALRDLDGLFAMESDILRQALGDAGTATRLLSDVSNAIHILHGQLEHGGVRGPAIVNLQARNTELREQVCEQRVAIDAHPEVGGGGHAGQRQRRIMRAFRVTGRALKFVGGAALIVADGAAAVANPAAIVASIASALAGREAMDDGAHKER
jgi:hypothetical protein